MIVPKKRLLQLTTASAVGMGSAFILNICLAKVLSVDDYGATRVLTAYLVILSMVGQFAISDALSSSVARATGNREVSDLFVSASVMTVGISVSVMLIVMTILEVIGYGSIALTRALVVVSPLIPLIGLTQVYAGALQAVGGYRGVTVTQVATGIVPLAIVMPASVLWALPGWLGARVAAGIVMLCLTLVFVRQYFSGGRLTRQALSTVWSFSRVQIASSVLSLVLMGGDILLLERVSGDMAMVANYSLGALIVRSFGFIPAALGRAYFVDLSLSTSRGAVARRSYLKTNFIIATGLAAGTALIAPPVIGWLLGTQYAVAGEVIVIWSLALVALFHWQAVSIINVAKGIPARSVAISFAGSVTGVPMLLLLSSSHGAVGAAWACVIAYSAGALLGTWNLRVDGLLKQGLA
jgi:O-antigen/teichoic acid export membrane protein